MMDREVSRDVGRDMTTRTSPKTVSEIVSGYTQVVERYRPYVVETFDVATADDFVQYVWEKVLTSNILVKYDPTAGAFQRYFSKFVHWAYISFMRDMSSDAQREVAQGYLDPAAEDPTEALHERSDLNRVAEFVTDHIHGDLGLYLRLSVEGYEDQEIGGGMLPGITAKKSTFHAVKKSMLAKVAVEFPVAA